MSFEIAIICIIIEEGVSRHQHTHVYFKYKNINFLIISKCQYSNILKIDKYSTDVADGVVLSLHLKVAPISQRQMLGTTASAEINFVKIIALLSCIYHRNIN